MTRTGPLGDDALSLMADVAGVQVIKERILMPESTGRAEADYFFGSIVSERQFAFRWARDGATYVMLAAAVPDGQFQNPGDPPGIPDLVVSLTVVDSDRRQVVLRLKERMSRDPDWEPDSGRPVPFEIGFVLPPGAYQADYSLYDARSHLGSAFSESLTVPDFRNTFTLSDVTLAHASGKALPGDPGELGGALPFPDPGRRFHPGETLHLSFQVYNAGHRDAQPDLEVEYELFYKSGSELWLVGKPVHLQGVIGESLGYSLPLAIWPEGDYQLRVRVTDNLTGSTAERKADFTLRSTLREEASGSPVPEP
jgi:hypothetical protein